MNPVPVGVPGELLIGGDGLARGYLLQPEQTAQAFVADPFSSQPGQRLYRTGDQARYRPNGTIEFLGRLDEQLKVRGFRIEPGEIEYALCQHPGVAEAVVVAVQPAPGNTLLAAYLVLKATGQLSTDEVRTYLRGKLPPHLVPTVLLVVDALPLTANGKLDKRRLPPVTVAAHPGDDQPPTLTETALMDLWTATLGNAVASREANFFDLGGSSLLAMYLIARIQHRFNRVVSMKEVFQHPTVRQLSTYLDQLPPASPPKTSIGRAAETQTPLSFAQMRLWLIHQLHDLEGTYNVPIVLKVNGLLDQVALRAALTQLMGRHHILRTTFGQADGQPYQQTAPLGDVPYQTADTVYIAPARLADWLKTKAYQPFTLTEGPLVRLCVARTGANSWLVLLVFHHLIYDGWSTRVLASELSQFYTSLVRRQPVSLPPVPVQYADYARWQAAQQGPPLDAERAYWKNRLTGAPFQLALPVDRPYPASQSFGGADCSFQLPAHRWQVIRQGLHEPGTTTFLRLLAVFAVWLSRETRQHDLIIGVPVAGRQHPELADSIGFFVNTVALRIGIASTDTFRGLLRQVRQVALDAYDHQNLPFEQVIDLLKLPRTLAHTPLVQVMFDVQDDRLANWHLADLQVESVPFEQHTAKFDLHLSCRETADGVVGTFNYRADLFTPQTVSRLAGGFIQLLDSLAANPDKPLEQVGKQVTGRTQPVYPRPGHPALIVPSPAVDEGTLMTLLRLSWCRLLPVSTIGPDDDFFELGGNSLLAFQLTTDVHRQVGYPLSVGSIFANPTLRQLAAFLQTHHPTRAWPSLVPVRSQGNELPLFLVHPVSGDIAYVYQLASHLPANQPVYGLRAVGLDGLSRPHDTIETMAAHYVQLIVAQQPEGPYAVGGFSLGGIIAYEMARQLRTLGKTVRLVALIDCYPMTPDPAEPDQLPLGQLLRYYQYYWRSLPLRPRLLWNIVQRKVPVAGKILLNKLLKKTFGNPHQAPIQLGTAHLSAWQLELEAINKKAYSRYKFRSFDGKAVLLRSVGKETLADLDGSTSTFGWNRYVQGGVKLYLLPGTHQSLFQSEAIISRIARILMASLIS